MIEYSNILSPETVTMSVKVVCRTIGYSNILSLETVAMSAKIVDIDIGYAQEALMSSGGNTKWE
ncbi:hypothetical protein AGMMS49531_02950 [Endomicrobiia bacterium]|nr:hypothetical protein AGMMS49531_02950 [Endomicrobiia bacterium]